MFTSTDRDHQVTPYVHQDYPRHVKHVSGDGRWQEVKTEAAWIELGPEWGHPQFCATVTEPDGGMVLSEPASDVTLVMKPKRKARA